MVVHCTVCMNNNRKTKNISYFNYPKESTRRRAWLIAVGREDLIAKIVDDRVRQQYRICEDHFEKTCIKFSKGRTMKFLLDSAFPTLNLQLYNRTHPGQSTEENPECQNEFVTETPSSSNVNLIKINNLQSETSCNIETDAKDIGCTSESRPVQSSPQLAAINLRKRKLPYDEDKFVRLSPDEVSVSNQKQACYYYLPSLLLICVCLCKKIVFIVFM